MTGDRTAAAPLVLLVAWALGATACGEGRDGDVAGDGIPEGAERVVNSAEGRWGPGEAWRLEEDLRIGGLRGGGPDVFGGVASVAVDDTGRIYVLDGRSQEIRLFDAAGRHVRTFGGAGEGPGEIALGAALLLSPAGDLWVHDARGQRFTVYDTAGAYLRSHPIRTTRFLQGHRFDREGRLLQLVGLDRGGARDDALVRARVAPDGALLPEDTMPLPELPQVDGAIVPAGEGGMMAIRRAPLPFVPRPQRILDPRGYVWTTAVDGSYRLVQHGPAGRPVRVVEREFEPVPVRPDERAEALRPFRDADVDEGRIPEVHPPIEAVHVSDDGRLWVWRRAGPERMAWDVFDEEGRYLGEVASPYPRGRFRLMAVRPDALYGAWLDELDVSHVVRLAVERPQA